MAFKTQNKLFHRMAMQVYRIPVLIVLCLYTTACGARSDRTGPPGQSTDADTLYHNALIRTGAERMDQWLERLDGKRTGLVVNHTSRVDETHLADTLLTLGYDIRAIFAPEHGFRGTADAGATIADGRDTRTGLPVYSLYGSQKKPSEAQLRNIDLLIFDIQDVGARFYTYISTMHYVMEAAAKQDIPVLILDRPNPNGHYIDGPVLDTAHRSFVGMHPVPVVHGMTIGEYAQMILGEGWLNGGIRCDLAVIPCSGYDHQKFYRLPLPPSPNLPNMRSVYLYPALCLFEGTAISVGRGTDKQFQVLGAPGLEMPDSAFRFTPVPKPGAQSPRYEGEECIGMDLSRADIRSIRDQRLAPDIYTRLYAIYPDPGSFFKPFFDKLAGGSALRLAIEEGIDADSLETVYRKGIRSFSETRKKYLLYPDFEP